MGDKMMNVEIAAIVVFLEDQGMAEILAKSHRGIFTSFLPYYYS